MGGKSQEQISTVERNISGKVQPEDSTPPIILIEDIYCKRFCIITEIKKQNGITKAALRA